MKKILLVLALLLLTLLMVGGLIFYFFQSEFVRIGAEQSLAIARSQITGVFPPDYPPEKILAVIDTVMVKAKSGQINTKELTDLLVSLPAKLQDGTLDSTESESVILQLQRIISAPQE